jgi:hypothetical protein
MSLATIVFSQSTASSKGLSSMATAEHLTAKTWKGL